MLLLAPFIALLACVEAIDSGLSVFGKWRRNANDFGHGFMKNGLDLRKRYPAYNFTVAVDHFHNDSRYEPHTEDTYEMRYWFDATYYEPGGPVIVLAGGETDAEDRLEFLQKGIVYELAEATHGLGVILEHRYYGGSWPTKNMSTESLRFLSTDQALADSAVFAQNIIFPGLEEYDLTAKSTPWIAYGGSYAGGFVSFLRKLYPDTFFGAISSSGVTKVIIDYWQYNEPIVTYGPPKCVANTQLLTHAMDNILTDPSKPLLSLKLQAAFDLGGISHPQDFMGLLFGSGLGNWQSRNWDPQVNNPDFGKYCEVIEQNRDIYNLTGSKGLAAVEILTAGGYGEQLNVLVNPLLNWIGWVREHAVQPCTESGKTQDECFFVMNDTQYTRDDLSQTWRAWQYQVCTEWGYFLTGSGVPAAELPILSRIVDLAYASKVCRKAFNITSAPDIEIINKHGGFKLTYPRLAVVVGNEDVWRPVTPLADEAKPWPKSTTSEPVILIEGAGHHWDENGLFPNETTPKLPPAPVAIAQREEISFVLAWLEEAKQPSSIPVGGYRVFSDDL